jgi:hypothetical protein
MTYQGRGPARQGLLHAEYVLLGLLLNQLPYELSRFRGQIEGRLRREASTFNGLDHEAAIQSLMARHLIAGDRTISELGRGAAMAALSEPQYLRDGAE